jgi:hypothetical protein
MRQAGRRWHATDSGSKPGFCATEILRAVLAQRANFRPFSAEFVSHIRRWCIRNGAPRGGVCKHGARRGNCFARAGVEFSSAYAAIRLVTG